MGKIYVFILINIFYVNEIFNKEITITYPTEMIANSRPFIYGGNAESAPDIEIKYATGHFAPVVTGHASFVKSSGNWGIQDNLSLTGHYLLTAKTDTGQKKELKFTNFLINFIQPGTPQPAIADFFYPELPFFVMGETIPFASVSIKIIEKDSGSFEEVKVTADVKGIFMHQFKGLKNLLHNLSLQSTLRFEFESPSSINFDICPNGLLSKTVTRGGPSNKTLTDGPFQPMMPDQNTVLDTGSPGFLGTTIPFSKIDFNIKPEIGEEFIEATEVADVHGHYKFQISPEAPLVTGRYTLTVSITTPSGEKFSGTYFITVTTTAQDNLTKAIIDKYGCKE